MTKRHALSLILLTTSIGCGGAVGDPETPSLNHDYGDDSPSIADEASSVATQSAPLNNGSRARTTTNLNLRRGPSTSNAIILTMPSGATVDVLAQSGVWYSVNYRGTAGWAHGNYLEAVTSGGTTNPPPNTSGGPVAAAMARAASGVGFSYHWGGGCWDSSSTSYGACYGSCPNCSHSGHWGADCSGYVGKVWQVPGAVSTTQCDHPYDTTAFYDQRSHWSQVSRGNAKQGDAFVRHGHIFLFDHGDPWGSITAYEAKGCSYGIVHDTRSADSSYIVIRRSGF
ncbi:MAG: SH3 domain-containing protein [Myxococcota bacterium]